MAPGARQLAIEYYFGDLQYWKLPKIAAQALQDGYDGPALRALACITDPKEAEMDPKQIDAVFREMGVADAPISKDRARLILAVQLAEGVVKGARSAFEAATHLRIHLCEFDKPVPELIELWRLAKQSQHASRPQWSDFEKKLQKAFSDFIKNNPMV